MYKKARTSFLKHYDFMIFDMLILGLTNYIIILFQCPTNQVTSYYRRLLQLIPILILICLCVSILNSSYKNILQRGYWKEWKAVVIQNVIVHAIFIMYLFAIKLPNSYSRITLFTTICVSTLLIYLERVIWKWVLRRHFQNSDKLPHLLVIGERQIVKICLEDFQARKCNEFFVSGVVLTDQTTEEGIPEGYNIVCDINDIENYLLTEVVDEVLLCVNDNPTKERLIAYCLQAGIIVHINLVSGIVEMPNRMIEKYGGRLVLTTSNRAASELELLLKRSIDILSGLAGLVLTGLVAMVIGPMIKKKDPGPIFFTQTRVGKNGRQFQIYKFRSMYMDAERRKQELMEQNEMDGFMFKMEDDPRILPGIGHFIRRWSLDELPQFLNILKGDMSLIGTRPPTVDEFNQYSVHHKMRLSFKPGLSGMWQVSGRNNIKDFEEIVALDNEYITNWSIGLDLKIILKTFKVVFTKDGSM